MKAMSTRAGELAAASSQLEAENKKLKAHKEKERRSIGYLRKRTTPGGRRSRGASTARPMLGARVAARARCRSTSIGAITKGQIV